MSFANSFAAGYGFRTNAPLTNEQILKRAPSVFAAEAHESRGDRYGFIPTINVLEGLRAEGFEVFNAQQTRTRVEGKRAFTKHLLRLRHPDLGATTNIVGAEVPEIVLINSHDGSSSYQLLAGFFRLVCSNGMIVASSQLDDVKVRHTGNVIQDVIEGSCRVIGNLKTLAPVVDAYKGITLDQEEQVLFAESAAALRWDADEAGNLQSPIEARDLLAARRYADRENDLWSTFNRVQENLIKGGIRGRTATGKRTSTRAIGGVNEDVKINRGLWLLTERMAALKTGSAWLADDQLTQGEQDRLIQFAA